MNEIVGQPPVVESESATTDHEHNHTGATPVVVSLVIVGVLALLAFLTFSITATAVATYYKSEMGTDPFGYYDDYGFGYDTYPYFSGDWTDSQTW